MSDTLLIIFAAVVICGAGFVFVISKVESKKDGALETEAKRLFPDGRLLLLPFCRGEFGATLMLPGRTYTMHGNYLAAEGGDGYLYIHCNRDEQTTEIQRFPLRMFRRHRALLLHSIRWLAGYEKEPNQPPQTGATSDPVGV